MTSKRSGRGRSRAQIERRVRRSGERGEALLLLLEAVRERSRVTSIAVVDARGGIVSGTGQARELAILGAVAEDVASGVVTELCERLTAGTDIVATAVTTDAGKVYLAALGDRVGRMSDAARGIARILAA